MKGNPARRVLLMFSAALLVAASGGGEARGQPCESYAEQVNEGTIAAANLVELSGLAFSEAQPGVIWTHNDSGDDALLYAVGTDGALLGTWQVLGAAARDWEDIALAPCAVGEARRCLLIADFGNNGLDRTDLSLFRVPEPSIDPARAPDDPASLAGGQRFGFSYPDGDFDAESLMVHPTRGDVFIVTKDIMGADSVLYHLPPLGSSTSEQQATRLVTRAFGSVPILHQATTGSDFTPDGQRFVVRTYGRAHEFFVGADADPAQVAAALEGDGLIIPIREEMQGEAIAYEAGGASFWTVSEGESPTLHRFTCERFGAVGGEDLEAPTGDAPTPSDADAPGVVEPGNGGEGDCACRVSQNSGGGPPGAGLGLLLALLACSGWRTRRDTPEPRGGTCSV